MRCLNLTMTEDALGMTISIDVSPHNEDAHTTISTAALANPQQYQGYLVHFVEDLPGGSQHGGADELHETLPAARQCAEVLLGQRCSDNASSRAALLEIMASLERVYGACMGHEREVEVVAVGPISPP